MTTDAAGTSGVIPGRGEVSQSPDHTSERGREPARTSLLRRARRRSAVRSNTGGWSCPECRLPTKDPVAVRLGFCARCHEFTGMCAAGRKIVCCDVMSMTTWHTPCTNLGASAWQISQGAISRVALLCPQHDAEVRAGRTWWLSEAIPLTPAGPFQGSALVSRARPTPPNSSHRASVWRPRTLNQPAPRPWTDPT
jgi:hypothetical protein